ncbi:MAG: protein kinase domain-containing protein [Solirubrobacteraceae bacterium]
MSTLLGTTLSGRYRLEARIGAGGMSTVYRALDETLQRRVAIKLMNREIAGDADQLARFRREARAVAQLSHAHVVGVIDAGEDAGQPYIVFEYVAGENLKERIRRLGRLPIAESVAYAIEIARALAAAHARQIVHRDVKPQNVLIDEEGSVKVTDFGIARTLEEDGLTADGRVIGTTDYVSPEQALGQVVTGQSDLYSLGVALYEMLTGEVPFKGEGQVVVAMKHVREPFPDVRAKRPEVSATLAALIEKATTKRAQDRYENAEQLIADLEDVLAIETARAGQATGEVTSVLRTLPRAKRRRVPYPIRHRARWLLSAGGIIAIAVAAVVWFLVGNTPTHVKHHHAPSPVVASLTPVRLCPTCAAGFNPLGSPTDEAPGADNAIDGSTTPWQTQQYYSRKLDKAGTGLYVEVGTPVAAKELKVLTTTPGFTATVYGRTSVPPLQWPDAGWVRLSAPTVMVDQTTIPLSVAAASYTYYLLWITDLGNNETVRLNQLSLYR